jgi:CheY-like chemotaxis protein
MKKTGIMIVEDNEDIAEIVEIILTSEGYRIAGKAVSGEKALALLPGEIPDLVLMDINLNGSLDGIKTASYISHLFNVPIIFMTGLVDDSVIEKARIVGSYGFQKKPFKKQELLSNIKIALMTHDINSKVKSQSDEILSGKSIHELSKRDEGIIISGMDGEILYINRFTEEITGFSNTELIMKSLDNLLICSGTVGDDITGGKKISESSFRNPSDMTINSQNIIRKSDESFVRLIQRDDINIRNRVIYLNSSGKERKKVILKALYIKANNNCKIGIILSLTPDESIQYPTASDLAAAPLGQEI